MADENTETEEETADDAEEVRGAYLRLYGRYPAPGAAEALAGMDADPETKARLIADLDTMLRLLLDAQRADDPVGRALAGAPEDEVPPRDYLPSAAASSAVELNFSSSAHT